MSSSYLFNGRDVYLDWISTRGHVTEDISTAPPTGRVRITGMNQKSIVDLNKNNGHCVQQVYCTSTVMKHIYSPTSDRLTGDTRWLSQSPPALLGFLDWHSTCSRIVWTDDEAEDQSGDFLLDKHRNSDLRHVSNLPKNKAQTVSMRSDICVKQLTIWKYNFKQSGNNKSICSNLSGWF